MFDKLHQLIEEGKVKFEGHRGDPSRVGFKWAGKPEDKPDVMFEDPDGYVNTADKRQWLDYANEHGLTVAEKAPAEPAYIPPTGPVEVDPTYGHSTQPSQMPVAPEEFAQNPALGTVQEPVTLSDEEIQAARDAQEESTPSNPPATEPSTSPEISSPAEETTAPDFGSTEPDGSTTSNETASPDSGTGTAPDVTAPASPAERAEDLTTASNADAPQEGTPADQQSTDQHTPADTEQ